MNLNERQVVFRGMGEILVERGYLDAGDAGTEKNIECTLIVTNSKAGRHAYSVGLTSMDPSASDKYGALIIKDQFINVRDENETNKIPENIDINNMIKLLGLDYEKKYDTQDEVKTLRYGKLLILADQNNNGCYFKGLVINFIHNFWPDLLKFNFIHHLVVPVVRAIKGQEVHNFFSLHEYKAWKITTPGTQNYQAKYYKSLGELSSSDLKDVFVNLEKQIIKFTYTEHDDESIILAFSGEMVEQRQDWIRNYMEKVKHSHDKMTILYKENTSYSEFINLALIQVFVEDIEKTIPNVIDGLTKTERLALLACMREGEQGEIEINELVESIARKSSYKDRDTLVSAIMRLTENFVGSNNINLLQLVGTFDTKVNGEKSHSSSVRNLRVKLNPLARVIFRMEEYIFYHDNRPVYYAPIIPMILINGADGKGKIWKTKILNYNPRDVIDNLLRMINGEEQKPMMPDYKKFKGTILCDGDNNNYAIFGKISLIARDKIGILELPVGCRAANYRESVLEPMLSGINGSSGMIEDYQDLSSDTDVKFVVTINPEQLEKLEQQGLHNVFKLAKKISVNSMHAFDDNLSIKYYPSVAQIMLDFFNVKHKMYEDTKNYLTGLLKAEILKLSNQIEFIVQAGKNQIHIYGHDNLNALINALKNHGYDPDPVNTWKNNQRKEDVLCDSVINTGPEDFDYLLDMNVRYFTEEKKNELIKIRDEKENKLASIESKTANQIWRDDLEELLIALDKSEEPEEMEVNIPNNNSLEMESTEPQGSVTPKCNINLERQIETEVVDNNVEIESTEPKNIAQKCHVDSEKQVETEVVDNNVEIESTEPEKSIAQKCHVNSEKQIETKDKHEPVEMKLKEPEKCVVPECHVDSEKQIETEVVDNNVVIESTEPERSIAQKCHNDLEQQMETEDRHEPVEISVAPEAHVDSEKHIETEDKHEPVEMKLTEPEKCIAPECHVNSEEQIETEVINSNVEIESAEPERRVASEQHVYLKKQMETEDRQETVEIELTETEKCVTPEAHVISEKQIETEVIDNNVEIESTEHERCIAPECHVDSGNQMDTEVINNNVEIESTEPERGVASKHHVDLDKQMETEIRHEPVEMKLTKSENCVALKCHADLENDLETGDNHEPLPSDDKETEQPIAPSLDLEVQSTIENSVTSSSYSFSNESLGTSETPPVQAAKINLPSEESQVNVNVDSGVEFSDILTRTHQPPTPIVLPNEVNHEKENYYVPVEKISGDEPEGKPKTPNRLIRSILIATDNLNSVDKKKTIKRKNSPRQIRSVQTRKSVRFDLTKENTPVQLMNESRGENVVEDKIYSGEEKTMKSVDCTLQSDDNQVQQNHLNAESIIEESPLSRKPPPRKKISTPKLLVLKNNNENQLNLSTLDEVVEEIKIQALESPTVEEKGIRKRGRPRKSMDNLKLNLPEKELPLTHESPPRKKMKTTQDLVLENNNENQLNFSMVDEIEGEKKLAVIETPIIKEKNVKKRGRPWKTKNNVELIVPETSDQVQQNDSEKEKESPVRRQRPRRTIHQKLVQLVTPTNNSKIQQNDSSNIKMLEGEKLQEKEEEKEIKSRGRSRKLKDKAKVILPKKSSPVQQNHLDKKMIVEEEELPASGEPPCKKMKIAHLVVSKNNSEIQHDVSKNDSNVEEIKLQGIQIPIVQKEKKETGGKPRKTQSNAGKLVMPKAGSQVQEKIVAKKKKPRNTIKFKFFVSKNSQPVQQDHSTKNENLKEKKIQKNSRMADKKVQPVLQSTSDSAQQDIPGGSGVKKIKLQEITKPIAQEKKKETRGRPRKIQGNADKLILPETGSQVQQKVVAKKRKPARTIKFKFVVPKKVQPVPVNHSRKNKILNEKKIQRKPRQVKKKVQTVLPSTNDAAQQDTLEKREVVEGERIERRGRPVGTTKKAIEEKKKQKAVEEKKRQKAVEEKNPARERKVRNAKVVAGFVLENYVSQLHRNSPRKNETEVEKKSLEDEKKNEAKKLDKLWGNGISEVQQNPPRKNGTKEKKPSRERGRPAKSKKIQPGTN